MEKSILNEVETAYADAGPQRESDVFTREMRCLSFLTSEWLTPTEAQEAVERIGEYNTFKPETVKAMLRSLPDDALVAVGRESSPVLYVETDEPQAVIEMFQSGWQNEGEESPWSDGSPDELGQVDYVSNYRKGWYDDRDPHSICKHGNPPVPVEDFVEGDSDRAHVRAWWD